MQLRKFAGLVLCSLCFIITGDAQSPDIDEKPVWTLEYIHVKPDKLGLALSYLDDHWMQVREEAKRRGVVLIITASKKSSWSLPAPRLVTRTASCC